MIDSSRASPEGLSRFLYPELETELNRVDSICNDGVPVVKTLIDYLEAANLIDGEDANWAS